MNRLLFFSAGFYLIFAVSCSSSSNDNNTQTRIINIPTYKVEDRNAQDCRKLFSDAKRVSLKSTDKNTTLANIGSIKFERDHLYVLDDITRKLIKYDQFGNPIQILSHRGRGHGEYLDIVDFCIDNEENVFIVDGQRDIINKYSRDFEFLSTYNLHAEIDLIQILDNGNFLLGLSSWNNRKYAGDELIITDGNFKKIKTVARYGRNIDDNYWVDSPRFVKTEDNIIYHRTIDDHVYILNSADGELKEIINFDFGSRTIKEDERLNIENKIETQKFKDKTTLKSCFSISKHNLFGTLFDNQESRQIYMDMDSRKITIFHKDKSKAVPFIQFCGAGSGYLLAYELEQHPNRDDETYTIYLYNIH